MSRLRLIDPASLHHVWRGPELASSEEAVLPTGHPSLDAQLPGGGWPVGGLIEVLQERAERHVWQLLLPALAQAIGQQVGPAVLVNAPFEPFTPSLAAQGLPGERLLCIKADKPSARLWAAEQSLRCADVVAVLAWLPRAKSAELRRLHMAAQQHDKLLFVMRELSAALDASPARLRLRVEGAEVMRVHIVKRRGPPLETPLELPAYPARLAALLQARKARVFAAPIAASTPAVAPASELSPHRRSHVLDRAVALP